MPKEPNTPRRARQKRNMADMPMRLRTLIIVAVFVIFGFGLLIYQLYVLQLRDAEQYRIQATEQQLSDEWIPATRGSIYSSTGKLLAKSTVVWNIIANPAKCNQDYVEEASKTISEMLGGTPTAEEILKELSRTDKEYRVIAQGVDMVTAQNIIDYANTKRVTNGLPEDDPNAKKEKVLSIYKESSSTREYPCGEFLSSVLGFCGSDGSGMYGLEKSYDEELSGTPGRTISSENAWGYELANESSDTHDPVNGYNLHLTIDDNIQNVLETELSNAIEDYSVQNRGSAIVMNVKTGAIYGMATESQFDPNDPYAITEPKLQAILDGAGSALTAEEISTLQSRLGQDAVADLIEDGVIGTEPRTQTAEDGTVTELPSEKVALQGMIREAQWKNKAVTELYYPGSVFKLMTAAAALDSGLMDANQQFYCGSNLTVFEGTEWEHTYRCAEGNAHGWLDMAGALNESCNLYFIQAAEKMSPEFFYNYYQAFGLTQTTGIDLPYEAKGISKTQKEMEDVVTDLYSTAFGQSQKLTLIQMATAVAATVNGGYLVTPYVVDTMTDDTGNIVWQSEPEIRRQVVSEEVSRQICAMMENNVGNDINDSAHKCRNAYVAGYSIGGKSGTGEQLDWKGVYKYRPDGDYRKAISFAAILPADDPEILVLVMLDDPRWLYDYASQIVAPITGNIISQIAPYLGIERDASYDENGTVTVPNLIGTRWTAAQVHLNAAGLSHRFVDSSDGDVIYQYPAGGTTVPAGSTVYCYTQSSENQMATVPDAVGKTGTFAAQMLKSAGINAGISGDPSARVTAQDVAAGSSVPLGTVVTLTTGETSATDSDTNAAGDSAADETADSGENPDTQE
ncbi:MAG: penicillin-binding transpeptidase domain-containing protein [Oscillospiraceae bacterium]|nr:penicillin-binding transpeptidase domain-containing protein [Oscillospiraceae bacterium]